jgi:hypothetical protein
MGAGLGGVPAGKRVFMVITFKGEINATEAIDFNTKLNELLKQFNERSAHEGSGHVDVNNADNVDSSLGP